jgi:nucleobase:cation symporter-1, NCS1 family
MSRFMSKTFAPVSVKPLPVGPAGEIVELHEDLSGSPFYSHDMAPVPASGRKWGVRDLAVLWISMSACVPTYILASSFIDLGMNWWQAVLTIFLGNCIVLIPMALNAHAGTRYGIPFPVYCRAAFGLRGANVPAVLRALVACGWFGIQTWIGGQCLHTLIGAWAPGWDSGVKIEGLGITAGQLACFLAFWFINVAVVWRGIDTIRVLLNVKAPLLILLGLLLLGWAYVAADGFGPMLSQPSQFGPGQPKAGQFWAVFFPALTANVSFWATLSLNIPDFSRYARSQRDQIVGQTVGLPPTMGLYSFIGVAVTSATVVIFNGKDVWDPAKATYVPFDGKPIWDPILLLEQFRNPYILTGAMLALALATLATNIAANVVGPANDFAHLNPKWISFRVGGLITGILGILIQPWRLLESAGAYIFTFLVGYSLLLGACGGVLIADYWILRRRELDLPGLYRRSGPYWYFGGWNLSALIALLAGMAVSIPGFVGNLRRSTPAIWLPGMGAVPLPEVSEFWINLYDYAWFVSFGVSAVLYVLLTLIFGTGSKSNPAAE